MGNYNGNEMIFVEHCFGVRFGEAQVIRMAKKWEWILLVQDLVE